MPRWLFTISYPTRAHEIIVKYPSPSFSSIEMNKVDMRYVKFQGKKIMKLTFQA